jgi:hypothetical protein
VGGARGGREGRLLSKQVEQVGGEERGRREEVGEESWIGKWMPNRRGSSPIEQDRKTQSKCLHLLNTAADIEIGKVAFNFGKKKLAANE